MDRQALDCCTSSIQNNTNFLPPLKKQTVLQPKREQRIGHVAKTCLLKIVKKKYDVSDDQKALCLYAVQRNSEI